MIPNDLTGFSVEQLKGFATAIRIEYDAISASELDLEAKVSAREQLLDDRDRLESAIEVALAAVSADEELANVDVDATEDVEVLVPDTELVLDEAVAAADMGGGQGPVAVATRDEANKAGGDTRKFVRNMVNGRIDHEERHSFTTMRRETKHVVREGQNANDAFRAAVESRLANDDKTAAACFCGPDDVINGIVECCDSVRPLSDTLPTITATGDVRYVRGLDLTSALTGVTQWTCIDQDLVDPTDIATWKPCFELDCPPEVVSSMYAVSACATFNTQQFIGNPDLISNLESVMQCAFSKVAELLVYSRLRDLSSKYTFGYAMTGYGASAQLLAAVGWALEAARATVRLSELNYTLALPAGLMERIITDGVIRGIDDYRTRADLLDRLAALGVTNVVELVDEIVCAPGPLAHTPLTTPVAGCARTAAPAHPVTQEILLYRPQDFLLGVGADIDLGITRSPELARQNKLQWFTEGFEFVEKIGCAPAIDLLVPFCASGVRPALGVGEDCTP